MYVHCFKFIRHDFLPLHFDQPTLTYVRRELPALPVIIIQQVNSCQSSTYKARPQ